MSKIPKNGATPKKSKNLKNLNFSKKSARPPSDDADDDGTYEPGHACHLYSIATQGRARPDPKTLSLYFAVVMNGHQMGAVKL